MVLKNGWRQCPYILALVATMSFAGQQGDSASGAAVTAKTAPTSSAKVTPEALDDPQRIALGQSLWQQQCRHCHGRSAYPGKAPKLKPRKYKPEFVFDRVTNGFRKMPPWKDIFSEEQRWSIVAYIMSDDFSP